MEFLPAQRLTGCIKRNDGVTDMGDRVSKKLKSTSGESIAETLVAVLIAAFALLMLAGTVNTASNLITNSQATLKTYYRDYNNLADPETGGTSATATVKTKTGSEQVLDDSVKVKRIDSKVGSRKLVAYG